jgi:hypothetical protein
MLFAWLRVVVQSGDAPRIVHGSDSTRQRCVVATPKAFGMFVINAAMAPRSIRTVSVRKHGMHGFHPADLARAGMKATGTDSPPAAM